jgi:hypothetical protein
MSQLDPEGSSLETTLATYFQQVLGVSSLRFTGAPAADPQSVLFLLPRALSREAQELFEKMILAMKLQAQAIDYEVRLKDLSLDFGNFSQVMEFVENFDSTRGESADPSHWSFTWSPEVLLQRPELKKTVWTDLQLVMKKLS